MTKIKLCGMMRLEDVTFVNEAAPDFAGVILAKGFRRTVSFSDAARFREKLLPAIPLVGVFVNPSMEELEAAVHAGAMDVIQLHGQETEETVTQIRKRFSLPVIRVLRFSGEEAPDAFHTSAEYLLLDSGTGSGEPLDWEKLKSIKEPYFLAGGLTPDNVAEAIRTLHPYGVDVSSGTETNGQKDHDKIMAFVRQVRAVQ